MTENLELLVLTDRRLCATEGHSLQWVIAGAAAAGARRFVFREKDLDTAARRALAIDCLDAITSAGATMAVASDVTLAAELGGLPVHLAETDPAPGGGVRFGRSCHNGDEVQRAVRENAAYVTVSPVFVSGSKPRYGPQLGIAGLAALAASAKAMPVFALGGIVPENCSPCIDNGAAGVAVMSWVMSAADPALSVTRLLQSLGSAQ